MGGSLCSLDSILLSNLETSYPDFQEIYRSRFQGANFGTVLRRNSDFEARKLGLVSVLHLLEKHRRLRPEKRDQLVQSLLNGDFNSAQNILQETKTFSAILTIIPPPILPFFLSPSDGRSLKKDMKRLTVHSSDSQFLLKIKDVHDEVLQPKIRDIEALTHSILLSLIDTTVGTMTREVTAMKQEVFRRTIQHEIKSEEMKLRNEALQEFIQKLNAASTGRNNLFVLSDLIKYELLIVPTEVLCTSTALPRCQAGGEIREYANLFWSFELMIPYYSCMGL